MPTLPFFQLLLVGCGAVCLLDGGEIYHFEKVVLAIKNPFYLPAEVFGDATWSVRVGELLR